MVSRGTPHLVAAHCLVGFLLIGCGEDEATGPPPTGSIEVSLSVAGGLPDADGCLISVDDGPGSVLSGGESLSISGLAVGTHTVTISDLAPNCSVHGEVSRAVSVGSNETTTVDFGVDCPAPGSILVSTATAGSVVDPDGYRVTLIGGTSMDLGVNDVGAFQALPVGQYELEISGVADGCAVVGENPRGVTVLEADSVSVAFSVACPPFYDYIAYVSDGDLWVMGPDGSNRVNLTRDSTTWYAYPAWAPDATRIAFNRSGDIWVLNTANMDLWQVTEDAQVGLCSWSPNGTRITYDSWTGPSQSDTWGDIYVVNADGSNPVNLTPGSSMGFEPAWSPVGNLIAFASEREGGLNIWVMEPDGSNPVRLSDVQDPSNSVSEPAFEPAWSRDGTRIAYVGPGEWCCGIWAAEADGSNPVKLAEGHPESPTWSPDGTRIAYHEWAGEQHAQPGPSGQALHQREIFVMQADGSNPVNVTGSAGGFSPAWSPGQP